MNRYEINSSKRIFKNLIGETQVYFDLMQTLTDRKAALDTASEKAERELKGLMIAAGANLMEYTCVPSASPFEASIYWRAKFYYCSPAPTVDSVYLHE